ncbi:hypothetical protein BACCAP_04772 [Pseudoflavonifractor capillosus ATCC 29799]|uniref:Uncharacterized protein n=1 Tax=Pseudoflavonifractor capillosus ATCC 29799 TaxID=411467 RepID=A6P2P0_9FIRM|nr:hypothetical protein BACCAP_04772 [Pseudoflavonifractor capillosus ATCC 29799]
MEHTAFSPVRLTPGSSALNHGIHLLIFSFPFADLLARI